MKTLPPTVWVDRALPPRRRLLFRVAVGVAVGLTVLLAVYAVLVAWAVQLTTAAVYRERLTVAASYATAVDGILQVAEQQIDALAAHVAWDEATGLPRREQPQLERLLPVGGTLTALQLSAPDAAVLWGGGAVEDRRLAAVAAAGAQALRTQRLATSLAHGPGERPHLAVVASPLRDARGEVTAALVGTVDLGLTGIPLVRPSGQSTPDADDVWVDIMSFEEHREGHAADGDEPDRPAAHSDLHLALLSSALTAGQPRAVLHEAADGSGHVVAFAPLERLSGGVLVEVREDVAFTVPRELWRIGLFFGATTVLLVALGAWWYTRRVTTPLGHLMAFTATLAAGNYDRAVPYDSDDELGDLARAFDALRRQLKEAFERHRRWEAELEAQVAQRTAAVHQLLGQVISAQEEERRRIARELHDGVAQDMAALGVVLDNLEATCRTYACPIGARGIALIARLREQVGGTLRELRRLLLDLRPSALDDLGLVPAVRWYVEHRLRPLDIEHAVVVRGVERRLPPAVETALFRVVQEAVNNAARHAAPHAVQVTLDFAPTAVVVQVADDGVGFSQRADEPRPADEGFGLAGMRERAALLGGRLDVHSAPGRGTRLRATIPLEVDDRAQIADRR